MCCGLCSSTLKSQKTSAGMFPCERRSGREVDRQAGNHGDRQRQRSPRMADPALTSIHRPSRHQTIQLAASTSASCKPTEG